MDIIEYLYKLTLDNYISNDILSDNPLFETILYVIFSVGSNLSFILIVCVFAVMQLRQFPAMNDITYPFSIFFILTFACKVIY